VRGGMGTIPVPSCKVEEEEEDEGPGGGAEVTTVSVRFITRSRGPLGEARTTLVMPFCGENVLDGGFNPFSMSSSGGVGVPTSNDSSDSDTTTVGGAC
jgi:hypothetical protein